MHSVKTSSTSPPEHFEQRAEDKRGSLGARGTPSLAQLESQKERQRQYSGLSSCCRVIL